LPYLSALETITYRFKRKSVVVDVRSMDAFLQLRQTRQYPE
jgi:hypothetical protein